MKSEEPGGFGGVLGGDAGGAKRIPELGDERVDAAAVVEPSECARDKCLATFAAQVEIGHRAITGERCSLCGESLVSMTVSGWHLFTDVYRRSQNETAEGVTCHVGNDVRPPRDCRNIRGDLGF